MRTLLELLGFKYLLRGRINFNVLTRIYKENVYVKTVKPE